MDSKFVKEQNIGFINHLTNLNLTHLIIFPKLNNYILRYILLSFKTLSGK